MAIIELTTRIHAPPERVFDLSRSIDAHKQGASHTQERAVGGVTSGLIGLGQEVTWEARHFGVRQRLTARITAYDRPVHFRDVMVRGAFASMRHDHWFDEHPAGTVMRDRFEFKAPLGVLGRLAEVVFLRAYMKRFLLKRNRELKGLAEGDAWRAYLPG